jgi:hypothetical protein
MKRTIQHFLKGLFNPFTNGLAIFSLLIFIAAFSSCRPKYYEEPAPGAATAGSVDFAKYVAVGSTISAGYMDGALYTEGQDNSFPNLIAQKIKEVNPSLPWVQPDINSTEGWQFNVSAQNPNLKYGKFFFANPACASVNLLRDTTSGQSSINPYSGTQSLITNLSVPFIRITNINTAAVSAGTNSNNPQPYYNRIVNTGTTLGIASEAKARQASFFTVYLGYVDALRYATSGGTTALVSTPVFQQNIEDLLDSLLATSGSKGVIATIPYVDLFPVVTNNNRRLTSTTDPAKNPIRFNASEATTYSSALGIPGFFSSAPGNKNYYAITTGASAIRQLNPTKDFIVRGNLLDSVGRNAIDSLRVRTCVQNLNQRTKKGLISAIANADVLDKDEVIALRAQIDAYNSAIRTAVNARNAAGVRIAIVDLNAFYTTLSDPNLGIKYGTTIIRANHPSLGPDFGGFYSLDRITPTPKGQALLANEFIKAINATWSASLHLYDPGQFRANPLP